MSYLSASENVGFSGIPQNISEASCATQYKMAVEGVSSGSCGDVNMFLHENSGDEQAYIHLNDNFYSKFKIDPNELYTFHDSDIIAGEITVSHTEDNFIFSDNVDIKGKLLESPSKELDLIGAFTNGDVKEDIKKEVVSNGHYTPVAKPIANYKDSKTTHTKVSKVKNQTQVKETARSESFSEARRPSVHSPKAQSTATVPSQCTKNSINSVTTNNAKSASTSKQSGMETFLDVFKREQGLAENSSIVIKTEPQAPLPPPTTKVPMSPPKKASTGKTPSQAKARRGRGPAVHEALQRIPAARRAVPLPNDAWHAPGDALFQCGPLGDRPAIRQIESSSSDDDNMPDFEAGCGAACVEESAAESRGARLALRRAALRRHVLRAHSSLALATRPRRHRDHRALATLLKVATLYKRVAEAGCGVACMEESASESRGARLALRRAALRRHVLRAHSSLALATRPRRHRDHRALATPLKVATLYKRVAEAGCGVACMEESASESRGARLALRRAALRRHVLRAHSSLALATRPRRHRDHRALATPLKVATLYKRVAEAGCGVACMEESASESRGARLALRRAALRRHVLRAHSSLALATRPRCHRDHRALATLLKVATLYKRVAEAGCGVACMEESASESRGARLALRRAALRRHVLRAHSSLALATRPRCHRDHRALATLLKVATLYKRVAEAGCGVECMEESASESRGARLALRRAALWRHVLRAHSSLALATRPRRHRDHRVLATLLKKQLNAPGSLGRVPTQTVNHLLALRGLPAVLTSQDRRKLREHGWSDAESGAGGGAECAWERCARSALTGARYCLAHVTRAPEQRLYAACAAVFAGGARCNQPLLPLHDHTPLCAEHAWKRDNYDKLSRDCRPKKVVRKRACPAAPRAPRRAKRRRRAPPRPRPAAEHTHGAEQSLSELNVCSNSSTYDSSEDTTMGALSEGEYVTVASDSHELEVEVGHVPPDDILDPAVLSQIPDEAFTEFFNQAEGGASFAESSELAAALEAVLDERGLDERGLDERGLDERGLGERGLHERDLGERGLGDRLDSIADCVFTHPPHYVKNKMQVPTSMPMEMSSRVPS